MTLDIHDGVIFSTHLLYFHKTLGGVTVTVNALKESRVITRGRGRTIVVVDTTAKRFENRVMVMWKLGSGNRLSICLCRAYLATHHRGMVDICQLFIGGIKCLQ